VSIYLRGDPDVGVAVDRLEPLREHFDQLQVEAVARFDKVGTDCYSTRCLVPV
jgi:hypothetical protein